jgi:hypothetical protein
MDALLEGVTDGVLVFDADCVGVCEELTVLECVCDLVPVCVDVLLPVLLGEALCV